MHRFFGGKPPQPALNTDELDPAFDYDFNSVEDDGRRYMRGGFQYKRHYGWKRIVIKVLAKYGDDIWLGRDGMRTEEAPGQWPVSYHGTNMKGTQLILKDLRVINPDQKRYLVDAFTLAPTWKLSKGCTLKSSIIKEKPTRFYFKIESILATSKSSLRHKPQ